MCDDMFDNDGRACGTRVTHGTRVPQCVAVMSAGVLHHSLPVVAAHASAALDTLVPLYVNVLLALLV